MKKWLSVILAVSVMMSCLCVASASAMGKDDGSVRVEPGVCLVTEEAIERDNMNEEIIHEEVEENEENCGSIIVGYSPKDESAELGNRDLLVEGNTRETTKPKDFWNIAKDGIYEGGFTGVAGTMYTKYYFDFVEDTAGDSDYCYYTRVDVSTHLYLDTRTFKVQNYCTKCGLVSESKEYTTPGNNESTGYIYLKHYFTKKHEGNGHFMYPAVVCTNRYGQIDGTIDVNYYNTWK